MTNLSDCQRSVLLERIVLHRLQGPGGLEGIDEVSPSARFRVEGHLAGRPVVSHCQSALGEKFDRFSVVELTRLGDGSRYRTGRLVPNLSTGTGRADSSQTRLRLPSLPDLRTPQKARPDSPRSPLGSVGCVSLYSSRDRK